MLPPRKSFLSSRPSTTLASVTVGCGAAAAVGGGAGHGAGAARPDAEGAAMIDVGDRAAAGADRVDVDHRQQQREAGDRGAARVGLGKAAVDDNADVGAGSADVEGDQACAVRSSSPTQAPPSTPAASPDSSVITGRSATMAGVATPPFEAITRRSALQPGVAQRTFEAADVAAHLRSDERAQRRGGEPLELAELRRDRRRRRDEHPGQFAFAGSALRAFLVRRIEVGEQEADRDRFDPCSAFEARRGREHAGFVERLQLFAARRDEPSLRPTLR